MILTRAFTEAAAAERDRMRRELADVEARAHEIRSSIGNLDVLLGQRARSSDGLRGAELRHMAVAILQEMGGGPAHYRAIHAAMNERGYVLGGVDTEATLLTQLTRAPEVERAGRGLYQIRDAA